MADRIRSRSISDEHHFPILPICRHGDYPDGSIWSQWTWKPGPVKEDKLIQDYELVCHGNTYMHHFSNLSYQSQLLPCHCTYTHRLHVIYSSTSQCRDVDQDFDLRCLFHKSRRRFLPKRCQKFIVSTILLPRSKNCWLQELKNLFFFFPRRKVFLAFFSSPLSFTR